MIRIKNTIWFKKKSFYKNVLNLIGKVVLSIIPLQFILDYIEKVTREYKYEDAEYLDTFMGLGDVKPYNKEWFEKWEYISFEKKSFRIPSGYREILRAQYGDYMQLPPENERVAKHYAKVWWK